MAHIAGETICTLFDAQVAETPERIAVVGSDLQLSYGALAALADQIAAALQPVRTDEPIALLLDRSATMIACIMGVLKAGGAYLPLNPGHPSERIVSILNESNTGILVSNQAILDEHPAVQEHMQGQRTIDVTQIVRATLQQIAAGQTPDPQAPPRTVQPDDLAYIIYTSGSTGVPKGAMIEHCSVVHLVDSLVHDVYRQYGAPLKVALLAPFVFDASVQQIFAALLTGQSLHVVPEEVRTDARKLLRYYEDYRIDVSDGTPTHLKLLTQAARNTAHSLPVRHFIIGGEALLPKVVSNFLTQFRDSRPKITNVYGVTECCVDSSSYLVDLEEVERLGFVPIGGAMPHATLYILDDQLQPVPTGEPGQLYIGGPGVGRGYLNREQLTAECFRENPFQPGQRLYKTGDLAQEYEQGNIRFLGRADRQIKLRGYRIEPGDIEAAMLHYRIVRPVATTGSTLQVCKTCLLDSTYPGLELDEEGVCNICREVKQYRPQIENYFNVTPTDFMAMMHRARRASTSQYDCLLQYSGGKDSTYVLYRLVEMGFKVLAFTFDNGYISQTAIENIRRVTRQLGVDHVIGNSQQMREIFIESLRTDSTVCGGCVRAIMSLSTRLAQQEGINVVISGLSRGQIFDEKMRRLFEVGIYDPEEIDRHLLLHRKFYHARNDRISTLLDPGFNHSALDAIQFVDYFRYEDISTPDLESYLASKEAWQYARDTGSVSTNCRIDDVGIFVHQVERGFHNYAAPLSWDVRLGLLTREQALNKLARDINMENVETILAELGYRPDEQGKPVIRDAVVMLRQEEGREPFLCGYFTAEQHIDLDELREHLAKLLPDYMIPAAFLQMDAFPLTVSGKVDAGRLPSPNQDTNGAAVFDSPLSATEHRVLELWRAALGREHIGLDDDFLLVGGDSLSGITLVTRLEEAFGIELALVEAFSVPTVRGMARLVEDRQRQTPTRRGHGLVLLRNGASTTRQLFLLHDVYGRVDSYHSLSQQLANALEVWGIPVLIDTTRVPAMDIVALARQHVQKIRQIQPAGPYYLGGWSFGGIVAFEVAVQLEQQGAQVEQLFLIDSSAPVQPFWANTYAAYCQARAVLDTLAGQPEPGDLLQHVPDVLLKAMPNPRQLDNDRLIENVRQMGPALRALADYTPTGALHASIVAFRAHSSHEAHREEWGNLTRQPVTWHDVDGDHFSVLQMPRVELLASTINETVLSASRVFSI